MSGSAAPHPAGAVLITQCLQADFVGPVDPHDPLPNRLHVGAEEASRLLGADPETGPVAQLLAWARSQSASELQIRHIRDWHDASDPAQSDHLARFGNHCLRESDGARLILGLEDGIGDPARERVINSLVISDFEGTDLGADLMALQQQAAPAPLRVAVIGVWTDVKVSFILYDLVARLGITNLATCSALTASASRSQHFNALDQLHKVLGVECFDSVADLAAWLVPHAHLNLPPRSVEFRPRIGGATLDARDADIAACLYRDSREIALVPLAGGFSGSDVFKVTSVDPVGRQHAPSVLKIGPRTMIAQERVAFERIEDVLGNSAPAVRGFVDLGERAGIKYSYAAMGQGSVRTLKSLFEGGGDSDEVIGIIRCVFTEVLGPLYAAATYERLPLLAEYGFSAALAPQVRAAVTSLTTCADDPVLAFPGGFSAASVCSFYEDFLAVYSPTEHEFHYSSVVHGDLNAANVLVDGRENVWVIDYFHAGPGHVLKDLAKLENDLLYLLTPISDGSELAEALLITRAMMDVADLGAAFPSSIDGVHAPQLQRALGCIAAIRNIAASLTREDRNPLQLHIAQLRYAVHTLTFPEASPLQKQWALASACGFAEVITTTIKADRELRVDWLPNTSLLPGALGMTLCPGRRDRGRDLGADISQLRRAGTTHLLSLITDEELEWAGVSELPSSAQARGITHRQLAVPDHAAPLASELANIVEWCLGVLEGGGKLVLHCMGGLGRTGTVAACVLIAQGLSDADAISEVRSIRGDRAIESTAQEEAVHAFAAERTGR